MADETKHPYEFLIAHAGTASIMVATKLQLTEEKC